MSETRPGVSNVALRRGEVLEGVNGQKAKALVRVRCAAAEAGAEARQHGVQYKRVLEYVARYGTR